MFVIHLRYITFYDEMLIHVFQNLVEMIVKYFKVFFFCHKIHQLILHFIVISRPTELTTSIRNHLSLQFWILHKALIEAENRQKGQDLQKKLSSLKRYCYLWLEKADEFLLVLSALYNVTGCWPSLLGIVHQAVLRPFTLSVCLRQPVSLFFWYDPSQSPIRNLLCIYIQWLRT